MNKIIVGVIAIVIAIFLLRGCLQSDRRATVYAIAKNRPDCVENSVYVNDEGNFFSYTTKRGKVRFFSVEWSDGTPKVYEESGID